MKEKRYSSNRRIAFLLLFFVLLSVLVVGKLFHLQVIKHTEYTGKALDQINRAEKINSHRGRILDTNGNELAINQSATTVSIDPTQLTVTKEEISEILGPILDMNSNMILNMIESDRVVKLKQWVPRETAGTLRKMSLQGVILEDGYKRYYPLGDMASYIIGFTNVDNVGQYGIESSFNKELAGVPGRIYKSSDKYNRQIPTGEKGMIQATDGVSLVLTIDENIQKILYEESMKISEEFKADKVHMIVQDIETGDILGMNSYPGYDNNDPRNPIDQFQAKNWAEGHSDREEDWYKNWTNPIVSHNYEPGSTFKLITSAIALEENTTDINKQYYCTGYIRDIKNGPVLRCVSYEDPHGDLTLKQGLALSCNPTFIYVNRELGKEGFYHGIKSFGFGSATGITLPGEAQGIIPKSGEDISDLDLATMSYGHGIACTPLQLINAVSSMGNNGVLMTPRIVKELVNNEGIAIKTVDVSRKREAISPETAAKMLEMMEFAVEEGTASRAKSSMYTIGGKTGTANKPSDEGGYLEDQYISSFIGMAPMENPKITVLVVVDNPQDQIYGSIVAAPHAKNVIEKSLEYLGVEPRLAKDLDKDELVEVPDVENLLLGDAGTMITTSGLKYTTEYKDIIESTIVTKQTPKGGKLVPPGTIIDLSIEDNTGEKIIMPDLTGKSLVEVQSVSQLLELNLMIEGKGSVISQEVPPGKSVRKGTEIEINLSTEGVDSESEDVEDFADDLPLDEDIYIDESNDEENVKGR